MFGLGHSLFWTFLDVFVSVIVANRPDFGLDLDICQLQPKFRFRKAATEVTKL
jgi:hypothetical protein